MPSIQTKACMVPLVALAKPCRKIPAKPTIQFGAIIPKQLPATGGENCSKQKLNKQLMNLRKMGET